MSEKKAIEAKKLLIIANNMIHEHAQYINGMYADSVEEKAGIMVFKGNYFLDNNAMPSEKTTAVFNIFKYLALTLSKQYTLK